MANIPDFAFHLQEIERQLRIQADITSEVWQDYVQQRFYKQHVDKFCHTIEMVLNGENNSEYGIHARGMNKMLEGISECFDKMASVSETSPSFLFDLSMNGMHDGSILDSYDKPIDVEDNHDVQKREAVYNEYLERDYWQDRYNGPKPGMLDSKDVNEVMRRRKYGW